GLPGIEVGEEKTIWSVAQRAVRQIHARLTRQELLPRPGNLHLLWSRECDDPHRPQLAEHFRAGKAGVRLDGATNFGWTATQHHGDLSLEVYTGDVVIPLFRQVQA